MFLGGFLCEVLEVVSVFIWASRAVTPKYFFCSHGGKIFAASSCDFPEAFGSVGVSCSTTTFSSVGQSSAGDSLSLEGGQVRSTQEDFALAL